MTSTIFEKKDSDFNSSTDKVYSKVPSDEVVHFGS